MDDVKCAVQALFSELDDYFANNNFKRRKNGMVYSRRIGTTIQKIEMTYFSHPFYHRDALAHIYPHIQVFFPAINRTAQKFADGIIPATWMDKFTIRQPAQVYTQSRDFLVFSAHGNDLKREMIAFFEEYTMPLLDQLTREEDYIVLFENGDKRIIWDDNQYWYLISAYVNAGHLEKAYRLAETRFGKPGSREQYAKVFAFLESVQNR